MSISTPTLLAPLAWNQGQGSNTSRGDPCTVVSAAYFEQYCQAEGGIRVSSWHFLEETVCADGGFYSYVSGARPSTVPQLRLSPLPPTQVF